MHDANIRAGAKFVPPITRSLLIAALLLLSSSATTLAQASESNSADHAGLGHDITVTAGDIACAFCSVRVHGDVRGDVAVLFGSISVDASHNISGDVAVLGGDLSLRDDASIGGDVAIAAGDLYKSSGAVIRGSQAVFPGRLWLLVPIAPLLILIGLIWLVVYLVRRNRYRAPVYPSGRRV
jgi:hypothetical protein